MRTAELELRDLNGARIFAGFQLDNGPEWHVSSIRYSGVLIASGTGDLCKLISSHVHDMKMWSVHVHWTIPGETHAKYNAYDCYPDEMGGVVIDSEYLGYAEFMRRIIPKSLDSAPDLG